MCFIRNERYQMYENPFLAVSVKDFLCAKIWRGVEYSLGKVMEHQGMHLLQSSQSVKSLSWNSVQGTLENIA